LEERQKGDAVVNTTRRGRWGNVVLSSNFACLVLALKFRGVVNGGGGFLQVKTLSMMRGLLIPAGIRVRCRKKGGLMWGMVGQERIPLRRGGKG